MNIESFDGEIWTEIMSNKQYLISNQGRVYSKYSSKILKQKTTRTGYKTVHLRGDAESHPSVHRLVALHFVENPDNKPTVNHIDGDKSNNKDSNLEWATISEQTQHAFDNGLIKPRGKPVYSQSFREKVRSAHADGMSLKQITTEFDVSEKTAKRFLTEDYGRSFKLSDSDILEIKRLRSNGETLLSISKKFNCGASQIHRIVKGQSRNVYFERN